MMAIATKANCQFGDGLGAEGQEESPVYTLRLTNNTDQPLENLTLCVRSGACRLRWWRGFSAQAAPAARQAREKKRRRTRSGAVFHDGGVLVAAYSAASNPGRTGCVCNGVTVAVSAGATCAPVIFSGLLPVSARTTT